jgi:queuine tRNA-ribosyltransferase
MHSRIGPLAEAKAVYLEPSQVLTRLNSEESSPLLILDVGMGLATNILAILNALELPPRRELRIESYETTTEGLEMALSSTEVHELDWIRVHREKLDVLLKTGAWRSSDRKISWTLHRGDFRDSIQTLQDGSVELVFFDFYSPKTCPELWSPELFSELRPKLSEKRGLLLTYSSATPIRAALLLAGWNVGSGAKTLAKLETTLAAATKTGLPTGSLLNETWRRKLETSTQVAPHSWLLAATTPEERARIDSEVRARLQAHPQWDRNSE